MLIHNVDFPEQIAFTLQGDVDLPVVVTFFEIRLTFNGWRLNVVFLFVQLEMTLNVNIKGRAKQEKLVTYMKNTLGERLWLSRWKHFHDEPHCKLDLELCEKLLKIATWTKAHTDAKSLTSRELLSKSHIICFWKSFITCQAYALIICELTPTRLWRCFLCSRESLGPHQSSLMLYKLNDPKAHSPKLLQKGYCD